MGKKTFAIGLSLFAILFAFSARCIAQVQQNVDVSASVPASTAVTIQWAVPQGRVGTPGTNDVSTFYLTVRPPNSVDNTVLYTQPILYTTDASGAYSGGVTLNGIGPGTYDFGIKTDQALTGILRDVTIGPTVTNLNFTQADNSAPEGSQVLLAGDINGAGTSPATLGDDVVNSVDLSLLVNHIDLFSPVGDAARSDLNKDNVVNSVDLSLMIDNLDKQGEK